MYCLVESNLIKNKSFGYKYYILSDDKTREISEQYFAQHSFPLWEVFSILSTLYEKTIIEIKFCKNTPNL